MEETTDHKDEVLLLRAQKIGLLELNIQIVSILLERYQTELAQEKAIVQAQLRKEANVPLPQ